MRPGRLQRLRQNRPRDRRLHRALVLLALALAVSLAIPVALSGPDVFGRLGAVPAWVLGGAPALMLAGWCANTVRVTLLARANGYRLAPGYAWLVSAGGDFGAALGPGGITGIAAYVFLLARTGMRSATATALFTVDKLLDQVVFAAALA